MSVQTINNSTKELISFKPILPLKKFDVKIKSSKEVFSLKPLFDFEVKKFQLKRN
jgi:hypothetical protein